MYPFDVKNNYQSSICFLILNPSLIHISRSQSLHFQQSIINPVPTLSSRFPFKLSFPKFSYPLKFALVSPSQLHCVPSFVTCSFSNKSPYFYFSCFFIYPHLLSSSFFLSNPTLPPETTLQICQISKPHHPHLLTYLP